MRSERVTHPALKSAAGINGKWSCSLQLSNILAHLTCGDESVLVNGRNLSLKHLHRDAGYLGRKGSVCFVWKFALLPFLSLSLPSGVQISLQNRHRTFHTRISCTGVHMVPKRFLILSYSCQRSIGLLPTCLVFEDAHF